ncbi:MAG: hypothetical protein A2096_11320 [Spirochaetes bacterium GWF1_41_5]|nr:MAG: hypothetical protein A2096_11320 [Spirochaetes bacterium GWF1_41_5]
MKKIILSVFSASPKIRIFSFCLLLNLQAQNNIDLILNNSGYAFNGESGAYWEETRTTITYFENLFEPLLRIRAGKTAVFTLGAGLLVPFNQEMKNIRVFPFFQTRLQGRLCSFTIGSLENDHNLPSPILDPLMSFIPTLRVISLSQVPIDYEKYPVTGRLSHGRYEYGAAFRWLAIGSGELFMNWQLLDTQNHRERFDVGAAHVFPRVPFYGAIHYWHNGGQEHPHQVSITENYVWAGGLKQNRFTAVYLGSLFIADRDQPLECFIRGNAFYTAYKIPVRILEIEPHIFVSDELYNSRRRFISVEGDPFYRVPFYAGINFYLKKEIVKGVTLELRFYNGMFMPHRGTEFSSRMIRYDQTIKTDINFIFPVYAGKNCETKQEKIINSSDNKKDI